MLLVDYYWNIEWWTDHFSCLILFVCCICIVCFVIVQGIYHRLISFGKKHPIQMLLYEQKRWTRSWSLSLLWDQNEWGTKCSHIYKVSTTESKIYSCDSSGVYYHSSSYSLPRYVTLHSLTHSFVHSLILITKRNEKILTPTLSNPIPNSPYLSPKRNSRTGGFRSSNTCHGQ